MKLRTRTLVECAVMIAVATILNELVKIPMPLGGGLTLCSMLPLVLISFRHGVRTGLINAFAFSLLQLVIGFHNVQYGTNFFQYMGIALFDYVVAYSVIGLAGLFDGRTGNGAVNICLGIVFTFALRLACHFFTGWAIWEALWPNSRGWVAPLWSIAYNGAYMIPEMLLSCAVAALTYKPLRRLWQKDFAA